MVLCLWLAKRKKIHLGCCHAKMKKCAFVRERDSLFLTVTLRLLEFFWWLFCGFCFWKDHLFCRGSLAVYVCFSCLPCARVQGFRQCLLQQLCLWQGCFTTSPWERAENCFHVCSLWTGDALYAKLVGQRKALICLWERHVTKGCRLHVGEMRPKMFLIPRNQVQWASPARGLRFGSGPGNAKAGALICVCVHVCLWWTSPWCWEGLGR